MTVPRIDHYAWARGREAMLRFGPDIGPIVVVALPLFEEANRTRTFAVTLLRALTTRGIGGALPDLPATGESLVPTLAISATDLREAFEAAVEHVWAGRRAFTLAVRSGALLDTLPLVVGRWHLAPMTGAELVRELDRIAVGDDPAEIAGNLVPRRFLAELASLAPLDDLAVRTVRLDSDPRPAARKVAATPLWRRSEPGNDLFLAETLADDIASFIQTCGD